MDTEVNGQSYDDLFPSENFCCMSIFCNFYVIVCLDFLVTNNHSKETIYRGIHLTDELIKE